MGKDRFLENTTDFEFQKLLENIPNPRVGDKFSDTSLANAMGVSKSEERYRSVIERWKKYLMRTYNLLLIRIRTEGYEVADAVKRLDYAVDRKTRAKRQNKKAWIVIGTTDRTDLPVEKRPLYDLHLESSQRMLMVQMEEDRKVKMLPPAAVKPVGN